MAESKKKSSRHDAERTVTFEVATTRPLPVGQQVFISGTVDILGHWLPDGFPLTRLDDNIWSGYVVIANNVDIEFKITRGTWSSEEAESGNQPRSANLTVAKSGNVSFKHTVSGWIDRP